MARISIDLRLMLFMGLTLILSQSIVTSGAPAKPEDQDLRPDVPLQKGDSDNTLDPLRSGGAKARSKRCTCYSYKDKECVYYCHLDIIWINTPERTVPYGMSSYRGPQRKKRAAGGFSFEHEGTRSQRCICSGPEADAECLDFCQSSTQNSEPNRTLPRGHGPG